MENSEFKNIWEEVDGMLTPKGPDALKDILAMKAKKTIRRFGIATWGSIILYAGVTTFSIAGIIKHVSDDYYVINNVLLTLILRKYFNNQLQLLDHYMDQLKTF